MTALNPALSQQRNRQVHALLLDGLRGPGRGYTVM